MTYFIKRVILLIFCAALVAAAPGCTISEKDCLQNDWQTIGYTDGEKGRSPDVINSYAKSCAKHGVTPDASAYSAGFNVGITKYCTADNGIKQGERDKSYSGACPPDLEKVFLKNYIVGLRLKLVDLEIQYDRDTLELDRLRANRDRLAAAEKPHDVDDKRIESISSTLSSNTSSRQSINSKIRKWSSRL